MSSSPLDLRALEARLTFGDSLDAVECGALIAALRRTRAALSPTLRGVREEEALAWATTYLTHQRGRSSLKAWTQSIKRTGQRWALPSACSGQR